jgi:hypothetical protein
MPAKPPSPNTEFMDRDGGMPFVRTGVPADSFRGGANANFFRPSSEAGHAKAQVLVILPIPVWLPE